MVEVLIAAASDGGHRREYNSLFASLFAARGMSFRIGPLRLPEVLTSPVLFSPMLEEHTAAFLLAALARALLRRRSVALMFRPAEVVRAGAAKHRLKRVMLTIVRRFEKISILTILPFALEPAFGEVARSWIYDPQLWDVRPDYLDRETSLARDLRSQAGSRLLIVAIGAQNAAKGFDYLARIVEDRPELRQQIMFAAVGKVASASMPASRCFQAAGGVLIDRFIDDDEVASLYGVADLIWSCYGPDYDQASGIFGRAVQTGVPVIVRDGAYIEALSILLGHPYLALPWDDPDSARRMVESAPPRPAKGEAADRSVRMREVSLATLSDALGVRLTEQKVAP